MSAVTERATRRQLRRAMGESGVAVINSHADTLADVLKALEKFNARLTTHEDALQAVARSAASSSVITDQRSLLGRLKWLLSGR